MLCWTPRWVRIRLPDEGSIPVGERAYAAPGFEGGGSPVGPRASLLHTPASSDSHGWPSLTHRIDCRVGEEVSGQGSPIQPVQPCPRQLQLLFERGVDRGVGPVGPHLAANKRWNVTARQIPERTLFAAVRQVGTHDKDPPIVSDDAPPTDDFDQTKRRRRLRRTLRE